MPLPERRPVEVDTRLRDCCEKFEKCVKRLLPLILLAVYSMVGGFVFHLVEEPAEYQHRKQYARNLTTKRTEMIHRLMDVSATYSGSQDLPNRFSDELIWYHETLGVNEKDDEMEWNFWGALFYSMTLYTTIGYGSPSPRTTPGRVLTIFYSIVGIPLALAALVQLGIMVAYAVVALWRAVANFGRRPTAVGGTQKWQQVPQDNSLNEQQQDIDLLNLPVWLLFLVTVLWTLITAAIFLIWEKDWDYFTSLYFTIISFTTIGLGDVVPTEKSMMMLSIVFVLIGLALVSTLIAVVQQQMEAMQESLKRSIDARYKSSQSQSPTGEAGAAMSDDDRQIDLEIKKMVNELPVSSRFLYWSMSDEGKAKLRKYYRKKGALQSRNTQTDERWIRSSFLERIGEEDDRRSHDDVNSLVALCDFALR